jgi:hypothetical protein
MFYVQMTMVLTNPQPITVIDVDYILSKCFKDIIEMFCEASARTCKVTHTFQC